MPTGRSPANGSRPLAANSTPLYHRATRSAVTSAFHPRRSVSFRRRGARWRSDRRRDGFGAGRLARAALQWIAFGMPFGQAAGPVIAAGAVSLAVMEIGDNSIILAIPGTMEGGLAAALCWRSLAVAFGADPVNLWPIRRCRGHAVVRRRHGPTL